MNGADRETVRAALDLERRTMIAARASRPGYRSVAAKAERAQHAKGIVAEILPEPAARTGYCAFCGAKTKTDVCVAHADLVAS